MSSMIERAFNNINPENRKFIEKNTDIVEEVYKILEDKGYSQNRLAELLDKSPSEVSKYLSGLHNLTLRSITKMEVALGANIIMSCSQAKQKYDRPKYFHLRRDAQKNQADFSGGRKVEARINREPLQANEKLIAS